MDDYASPTELRVLERMLVDCDGDGLGPVERYLAAFPEHEHVVRQCHQRIVTPPPPPVETPPKLGPFVLQEIAGRGGQGVVWRAEDPRLGRQVALKVLSPQFAFFDEVTRNTLRRRFEREAIAASRVNAPGLCTVYEVSESDDVPWIAMQWIEGASLDRVIDACRAPGQPSHGPLWHESLGTAATSSPRQRIRAILGLLKGAALAVHAAHESGLVHRDLKPGNVMLTPQGSAVVLDFGLALDHALDDATLTRSHELLGSPAYMAPEQLEGDHDSIGRHTDVYALGVTLYECLSRRRPFEEPTRQRLFLAIRSGQRPNLRKLVPAVSRDLARVVTCATDPDPLRRYSGAAAMAEDLQHVLDGRAIRARTPGPLEQLRRTLRQHPVTAVFASMLVLLLVIVVFVSDHERAKVDLVNQQLITQNAQLAQREKDARWMAFVAGMRAAGAHYDNSEFEEARRQLEQCPEGYRGFAWRHLRLAVDQVDEDLGPSYRGVASRDGQVIANAVDTREVQIRDGNSGRELGRQLQLPEDLRNLALDGAGRRLVVATDQDNLLLYDTRSMALDKTIAAARSANVWLSPDGRHAALRGIQNDAWIIDIDKGEVRQLLPKREAYGVAFVDDEHLVTIGTQQGIRLWNLDGTLVRAFGGRGIVAVAASFDGKRIAAATSERMGVTGGITVFQVDGTVLKAFPTPHRDDIAHLAFRTDGEVLLSVGKDRTMHVWRATSGQRLHTVRAPWLGEMFAAWVSADGRSVFGSTWHRLVACGTHSGVAEQNLPQDKAVAVTMSTDERHLLVADSEGKIHVHDTATGQLARSVGIAEKGCMLAVAPWRRRIAASTADGELILLDDQLEVLARVPGSPDEILRSLAFAPGQRVTLLELTRTGRLILRNATDLSRIAETAPEVQVHGAVFARDGEQILAGIGQDVVVLNPTDLTMRAKLFRPGNSMSPDLLRVSPDGRWLAVSCTGWANPIDVHDLTSGQLHTELRKHTGLLQDMAFTSDSSRLIAAWRDGTLRIWHMATSELLLVRRDDRQIHELAFDSAGERLWLRGNCPTALEGLRATPEQLTARRHTVEFWPPAVKMFLQLLARPEPFSLAVLEKEPLPAELRDEIARYVAGKTNTAGGLLFVRRFLVRAERSEDDAWAEAWCRSAARKEPDTRALQATHALALLRVGQIAAAADKVQRVLAGAELEASELAFAYAVSALIEAAREQPEAANQALQHARAALTQATSPNAELLAAQAESALGR